MQSNHISRRDPITFMLACLLATFTISSHIVVVRILWPLVKWAAKKLWAFILRKFGKQPSQPKKIEVPAPELPTPDIFKGAPNLAPMKEFKL